MTKSEKLIKEFVYDHLDEFADIIKEVVKEHGEVSMPIKGDLFTLRGRTYMVVDVDNRIKNGKTGEETYGCCVAAVRLVEKGE